jgi:DNA replication licensing factor MCM7
MTARQLLSILRLSQAIARLRFSDYVAREDVDEAIRLIHMSKASLTDDDYHLTQSGTNLDTTSRIFQIIRDYGTATRSDSIEMRLCEAMVIRKGFTAQQLRTCIDEYQALNVIQVNNTGTHIHIL